MPAPKVAALAKPGAASTIAHRDESQTDHGCKRRPDQATPAEIGASATTGHKCGFNPANDQATDCAHHRGYASLQLLFGHSRHHGGGRPGCDLPQPPKLMAREDTSFLDAPRGRRGRMPARSGSDGWEPGGAMLGSNDLHVPPPRNRGGTADCACDQDEQELRGGDVCGGGRSPAPSRARG